LVVLALSSIVVGISGFYSGPRLLDSAGWRQTTAETLSRFSEFRLIPEVFADVFEPECSACEKDPQGSIVTVVVDQSVTVDLNTNPPTYTGDPDLQPYFSYNKTDPNPAKWKAIFDVGAKKLLIKDGATITVVMADPTGGNNRRSPGIEIRACELEIENGGSVVVNSLNRQAGNILIHTVRDAVINGIVHNAVGGTGGRPGNITIASCYGDIITDDMSQIETIGVDPGGSDINLLTCIEGDIVINGLVDASYKSGVASTINIASFNGNVTIDGNNLLYIESGTQRRVTSGVTVRSRLDPVPGNIKIQAKGDITVYGNTVLVWQYANIGAVGIKTASNSPVGGTITVVSLEGKIIASDRAFDNANTFNTNAKIYLLSKGNIELSATGRSNSVQSGDPLLMPVVSTRDGTVSHGGTNTLRSYAGSIKIGQKAQVLATPLGTNLLTSCTGVTNSGIVDPPATISTSCTPDAPTPIFNSCADFGVECRSCLIVEKQTVPDGAAGSFTFTGTASGTISDDGRIVVGNLLPGTYNSTETVPSGWNLTDLTCSRIVGSQSSWTTDLSKANATITLAAGEIVKCVFTDTLLGKIIVEKVTVPSPDTTQQSFNFTLKDGPSNLDQAFSLKDGESHDSGYVKPGAGYAAAETVPTGWNLTSATCDDGSPVTNIDVAPGETVKCTFTDEKSAVLTGSITIIKDTKPDDPQDFNYTTSGTGLSDFSLDDDGDNTNDLSNSTTFTGLGAGNYSVKETLPVPGFSLTGISCEVTGDGTIATPNPATGEVSITLGAGGTVKCTFTNEKSCKWCTKSAVLSQVTQNMGFCCAVPDILVDLRLGPDFDPTKVGSNEPATGSIQAAVNYINSPDWPNHDPTPLDDEIFIGVTAQNCGTGTVGSGDCAGQTGRGPYGDGTENVVITNPYEDVRLNVFGCSVDLHAADPDKPVVTIENSIGKVTVLDIHVWGSHVAGYLIQNNSDLVVVKNSRAVGGSGIGYSIKDDKVEITGSPEISGNDIGLQIVGNNIILRTNKVVSNTGVGIDIQGDNNVVRDEDVEGNGGHGIAVKGSYNEIKSNDVFLNGGDGINVAGNSNTIITNDVGEKSKGNNGDGIHVEGNGNTLDGNGVFGSGGDGIEVRGSNNLIKRNDVGERDKGNRGEGLYVVGAGNSLEENDAFANGGNGIHVGGGTEASPNVLTKNRAGDKDKGNGGNGIWVEASDSGDGKNGKVEIVENTAKSNKGVGIKVDGTAHQLSKNVCESNVGVEYYLAKGNFDSKGNKANGKSVSLKIPGSTGT